MQNNIDSACRYYDLAISDRQSGIDSATVKQKYSFKIRQFHEILSSSFDSMTVKLTTGKITDSTYQSIMRSLNIDSVKLKDQQLKELGVQISFR